MKLKFNIRHVAWWSRARIPTEQKTDGEMGKKSVWVCVCVSLSVCVCFQVFTTDVGVSRFYRMGIHLMADG